MDAIGEVELRDGRRVYLNSDGSWTAADEWLASQLACLVADVPTGPQHGPFGPAQLQLAAEVLGGRAVIYPTDEADYDPSILY